MSTNEQSMVYLSEILTSYSVTSVVRVFMMKGNERVHFVYVSSAIYVLGGMENLRHSSQNHRNIDTPDMVDN